MRPMPGSPLIRKTDFQKKHWHRDPSCELVRTKSTYWKSDNNVCTKRLFDHEQPSELVSAGSTDTLSPTDFSRQRFLQTLRIVPASVAPFTAIQIPWRRKCSKTSAVTGSGDSYDKEVAGLGRLKLTDDKFEFLLVFKQSFQQIFVKRTRRDQDANVVMKLSTGGSSGRLYGHLSVNGFADATWEV